MIHKSEKLKNFMKFTLETERKRRAFIKECIRISSQVTNLISSKFETVKKVIRYGSITTGDIISGDIDLCVVVGDLDYTSNDGLVERIVRLLNANGISAGSSSSGTGSIPGGVDVMCISETLLEKGANGDLDDEFGHSWVYSASRGEVIFDRESQN